MAVIAGGILGGNLPFLLLMLLLVTLGINEFLTITVDMGGRAPDAVGELRAAALA